MATFVVASPPWKPTAKVTERRVLSSKTSVTSKEATMGGASPHHRNHGVGGDAAGNVETKIAAGRHEHRRLGVLLGRCPHELAPLDSKVRGCARSHAKAAQHRRMRFTENADDGIADQD